MKPKVYRPPDAEEAQFYAERDAATDNDGLAEEGELSIPRHHDTHRMANVAVLRSALFGFANHTVPRTWYRLAPLDKDQITGLSYKRPPPFDPQPLVVRSLEGVELMYAGEELRQDDLSVALHLVWMRQGKRANKYMDVQPYEAIKALDWSQNRESVRRLGQSIWRMSECALTVNSKLTGELSGSKLIDDCLVNMRDMSRPWKVKLGSTLSQLLEGTRFRYVRHDTRRHLPPFAQWLYSFIATQPKGRPMPYPMPLGTLFRVAGLNTAPGRFHENRRKVREALELLERGEIETNARGVAVSSAASRFNAMAELDFKEERAGVPAERRSHSTQELDMARREYLELKTPRVVRFMPGVAPGWQLTGSTLQFVHI